MVHVQIGAHAPFSKLSVTKGFPSKFSAAKGSLLGLPPFMVFILEEAPAAKGSILQVAAAKGSKIDCFAAKGSVLDRRLTCIFQVPAAKDCIV